MTSSPVPAEMPSFTARIALWSARHKRRIVLAWLVIVIAAIACTSLVKTNTDLQPTAPGEAGAALKLFQQRFGDAQVPTQEIVVFSSRKYKVTDPVYQATVQSLMAQLMDLRETQTQALGGTTVTTSTRVVSATLTTTTSAFRLNRRPSSRLEPTATSRSLSSAFRARR